MKRSLFSLVLCLTLHATNVIAGQKYAFLVGISGYDEKQLKPLPYAKADIIEFRELLLQSGFSKDNIVMLVDDLSALPTTGTPGRYLPEHRKIREELRILLPALEPDDELVIGLAGHGIQFKGDDTPYFCPLDADLSDESTLISMNWLYDQLKYDKKTREGCRARAKLLIVDACRKDPESSIRRNSGGPELASLTRPQLAEPPAGVVALFSCAEGQEALEHDPLKHGVFFYHVLEGLKGKADGDLDQQVTLDEMIAFTKSKTTSYVRTELRAPQTPRQKGYFDGTWILRSLEDQSLITNSIGMKLKLIPAGEFLMGSSDADVAAALKADPELKEEDLNDERPQHRVKISGPFYAGVYEVTQGEYEAVMGVNPSHFSASGGGSEWVGGMNTNRFPVESVSWYDAVEFCNKLSQGENLKPYYSLTSVERKDGRIKSATVTPTSGGRQSPDKSGYRLPTEAEWEYMCRAGTTSAYHFGNVTNGDKANVNGDYSFGTATKGSNLGRPTNVGSYSANRFGLHDVHGNVMEWCVDVYNESAYGSRSGTTTDPMSESGAEDRVYRGGSWVSVSKYARSAGRHAVRRDYRSPDHGFRVVR